MQTVSHFLEALFLLSFLLPGLLVLYPSMFVNSLLLFIHASLLLILENILCQQDQGNVDQLQLMTSRSISNISGFVYLCSWCLYDPKVNLLLTNSHFCRLYWENRIDQSLCWILISFYVSKLSLLLLPVSLPIPSTLFLLFTISAPFYFYNSSRMTRRQVESFCLIFF